MKKKQKKKQKTKKKTKKKRNTEFSYIDDIDQNCVFITPSNIKDLQSC